MTGLPLRFAVHPARGTFGILGPGGVPVIREAWLEMETMEGDAFTSCQAGFRKSGLRFVCDLAGGAVRLELAVKPSRFPAGLLLDAAVRNRGTEPLRLREFRVLCGPLGGAGTLPGTPRDWRLLRMGYTFGGAHHEDRDWRNSSLNPLPSPEPARSFGMAAVRFSADRPGLVAGFTTSARQMTWFDFRRDGSEVMVSGVCETDGTVVAPGGRLDAERLYLGLHADLPGGLVAYGSLHAAQMKAALRPVPAGWCSWHECGMAVTERDVLESAKFIAANRRRLPLSIVQTDEGYESSLGDWLETKKTFPRGLARMAADIRKMGLVPGLWLAPFAVSGTSKLFREHPDWVVREAGGKPLGWEVEWADPPGPWYGLDGSNPAAAAWLEGMFRTLREWGYGYFKLDFLFMGCLRGGRARAGTRVEAYRAGLGAIRRGAKGAYILGCTAPYPPSVGLVDGMRLSHDQFGGEKLGTSMLETARECRQRFWTHRTLWNADADGAILRETPGWSVETARYVAASILASGGAVFAGDRLPNLAPERMAILEALAGPPPGGEAGAPLDLFEREFPRLALQPLGRGRWRLAVFNNGPAPRTVTVDLGKLGLGRVECGVQCGKETVPLGRFRHRLLTPPVPGGGALLLVLRRV